MLYLDEMLAQILYGIVHLDSYHKAPSAHFLYSGNLLKTIKQILTYLSRVINQIFILKHLKDCYCRGGVGDGTVKKLLINVLEEVLAPIRERRAYWEARIPEVYDILQKGSEKARATASATLDEVRAAMKINYFSDHRLIAEQAKKYAAGKK